MFIFPVDDKTKLKLFQIGQSKLLCLCIYRAQCILFVANDNNFEILKKVETFDQV